MDFSLPGSSVHGILQARILEWAAFSFSRGSYWLRDWTQVSCITGRFFTIWATRAGYFLNLLTVFFCFFFSDTISVEGDWRCCSPMLPLEIAVQVSLLASTDTQRGVSYKFWMRMGVSDFPQSSGHSEMVSLLLATVKALTLQNISSDICQERKGGVHCCQMGHSPGSPRGLYLPYRWSWGWGGSLVTGGHKSPGSLFGFPWYHLVGTLGYPITVLGG